MKGYLISKEGLQELFKKIYKEKEANSEIEFTLKDDNEIQYNSEDINFLFEPMGILETKRIIYANIYYSNLQYDNKKRRINLTLKHGEYGYIRGTISSYDHTWANGVNKSIEDIVKNFEKQNEILFKHGATIAILISLGIFILFLALLIIILNTFTIDVERKRQFFIIFSGLLIILLIIISLYLMTKFNEIYPPIEFQIGPEHKKIEKKRKNLIRNVIIIILIPLILNISVIIITNIIST